MKRREYHEICEAVSVGQIREVEHTITRGHGRVVACNREGFEVEVGDMHQNWDRHNCIDLKMR